jgi:hypothetical protein
LSTVLFVTIVILLGTQEQPVFIVTPEAPPPYANRNEASTVSNTSVKVEGGGSKKRIMLILFAVAFIVVAVGLTCALVGLSQLDTCATNVNENNLDQTGMMAQNPYQTIESELQIMRRL